LYMYPPGKFDAEFPKLNLCWEGYMAQYAGIKSTFSRLSKLLSEFKFDTLTKRQLKISEEIEEFPASNFGRMGFSGQHHFFLLIIIQKER
jgi:hypothetical protein